jgi:hypothetical protein
MFEEISREIGFLYLIRYYITKSCEYGANPGLPGLFCKNNDTIPKIPQSQPCYLTIMLWEYSNLDPH